MAGSCAAVGTKIQIDESTGMFDPVTALGLKLNADEKVSNNKNRSMPSIKSRH